MKARYLFIVLSLAIVASAHAQATRTWVSGVGDDANPCSRTAPCKTFAGAISKTADGGEISVLDPGGYGTVTITKGITINGEGTLAGSLNAGVNGIVVNAPTDRTIYIHKISINGAGTGLDGVKIFQAGTVVIEDSWIYGQSQHGIEVTAGANVRLKVNNTTIEHNTGDCIHMTTTAGQVIAMISKSRLQNCANGLVAVANVRADIDDTIISHGTNGVQTTGNDSTINIERSHIAFFSGSALKTNNSGTASHIRSSDTAIAQNGTAIDTSLGGTIDSFQGNALMGNAGSFTTTPGKQ